MDLLYGNGAFAMTVLLPQRTTTQIGMEGRTPDGPPPVLYLLHGLSEHPSADKARELGISWWENDPFLSGEESSLAAENRELRERMENERSNPETPALEPQTPNPLFQCDS